MVPASYPIRFSAQLRQHLRALRKQRGLTQARLGALIGVSQARIAEIEANPGLISVEQMMQLLSVLGGSLCLQEDEPSPLPPTDAGPEATPSGREKPTSSAQRAVQSAATATAGSTNLPAAYSFHLPAAGWSGYRVQQPGATPPTYTPASPAVTAPGIVTPDRSDTAGGQVSARAAASTDSVPKKALPPASDRGAAAAPRRSIAIRPKKGSW